MVLGYFMSFSTLSNAESLEARAYPLVLDERSSGTKCLKNHPCDVIKIREMRGKVRKKTP